MCEETAARRQQLLYPLFSWLVVFLCVNVRLRWGLKGAKRPVVSKAHGSISPSLIEFLCAMCEIAQPGGIAKSYYVPSISLGPTVHFTDWLLMSWTQFFFSLILASPALQWPDTLTIFQLDISQKYNLDSRTGGMFDGIKFRMSIYLQKIKMD